MISQAQATEVMKNYDVVNNKANAKRDSELTATIEDGDLFRQSDATFQMSRRLGDKTPYRPFTPVAVDPTGMAATVAPTATGYAVRPIDVAPLLAEALLSARSPGRARFATSPILTQIQQGLRG